MNMRIIKVSYYTTEKNNNKNVFTIHVNESRFVYDEDVDNDTF